MYYNCLLVLDLCNKDSILDHSNFSNILLQYFKIISSVACSQLLSYTPQLGYSAMMQWCPLRGIDSNKLQWKTRWRHPTLPAHRPTHTQQCKVDCQMCDCSWDLPGTIKIHWQSGDMVDGGMHCTGDLVRGNVRRARVLVTAVTLASASANAG